MARAVCAARNSTFNKDKVNHIAQRETGVKWAVDNGHEVVGLVEDLGISAGKYTPFQRPGLGPWLDPEQKLGEWDVIVFAKVDRAFRSTRDCVDFVRFIEQNKKMVVFADDGMRLDYRKEADMFERKMSEFFIQVASFFGELELARFSARSIDKENQLRFTTRWASGKPPFGFKIVDHPSGKGKCLAHDPEQQAELHTAAMKLLNGETFLGIAKDLGWDDNTRVKSRLSSPATQGIKLYKNKPVLGKDGNPIMVGPPSFTVEEWDRIQVKVKERSQSGPRRVNSKNMVLGVAFCHCGVTLSLEVSRRKDKDGNELTYRFYRCYNGHSRFKADLVESYVEEEFMRTKGHLHREVKIFVPGEDRSYELDQTRKSLELLRWEADNGLVDDVEMYKSRLTALTAKMRDLEASPVSAPYWRREKLSETYSEAWHKSHDPEERRKLLQESEIKLVFHSKHHIEIFSPQAEA